MSREGMKVLKDNLESSLKSDSNELEKRSKVATILLYQFGNAFITRFKRKEVFKFVFFCITMALLLAILIVCSILVLRLSDSLKENPEEITAFVTAVVSGITALLGLPLIIANYLFNKEEDKSITDLLLKFTSNDSEERKENTKLEAKLKGGKSETKAQRDATKKAQLEITNHTFYTK